MSGRKRGIPSYCHHKASGQAVARIGGSDVYLGIFDTPESHEKYRRLLAEHLFSPMAAISTGVKKPSALMVPTEVELVAVYWQFAVTYYQKNGRPTSEQASIRLALQLSWISMEA